MSERVEDYKLEMLGDEDGIITRIATVYDDLVDSTETPARSLQASETFRLLLGLMEYLMGQGVENPLEEWKTANLMEAK